MSSAMCVNHNEIKMIIFVLFGVANDDSSSGGRHSWPQQCVLRESKRGRCRFLKSCLLSKRPTYASFIGIPLRFMSNINRKRRRRRWRQREQFTWKRAVMRVMTINIMIIVMQFTFQLSSLSVLTSSMCVDRLPAKFILRVNDMRASFRVNQTITECINKPFSISGMEKYGAFILCHIAHNSIVSIAAFHSNRGSRTSKWMENVMKSNRIALQKKKFNILYISKHISLVYHHSSTIACLSHFDFFFFVRIVSCFDVVSAFVLLSITSSRSIKKKKMEAEMEK